MITAIEFLRDIGKFASFEWDPKTPAFSKFNLIFGYNGVGKTTISNALRLYSTQRQENPEALFAGMANSDNSAVSIRLAERSIKYTAGCQKTDLFVFNADFVDEHVYSGSALSCKEFSNEVVTADQLQNPIIRDIESELGKLSIKKESCLQEKRKNDEIFNEIKSDLSHEFNKKVQGSRMPSFGIPDQAPSVTIDSLNQKLEKAYEDHDLSGKQQELNADVLAIKSLRFSEVMIDVGNVSNLLARSITQTSREKVQRKIDELSELKSNDTSLVKWFEIGFSILRHIHTVGKRNCPLCDSDIRLGISGLLKDYQNYFDDEFTRMMSDIEANIAGIEVAVSKINDAKMDADTLLLFVSKYPGLIQAEVSSLKLDVECIRSLLLVLNEQLLSKKSIIEKTDWLIDSTIKSTVENYNERIRSLAKVARTLAESLDAKSLDPAKIVSKVRALIQDIACVRFDGIDGEGRIQKYHSLSRELQEADAKANRLTVQRSSELAKLKTESKFVNHYLKRLGSRNFEIRIDRDSPESSVKIQFETGVAKNRLKQSLSESEKTALAFAYFLSKVQYEILENTKADIRNTIFVLDDPVSSLDDNRLHTTAMLIESTFKDAKQLFVLSHNVTFMKFMSNVIGDAKTEKNNGEKESCRQDYYLCGHSHSLLPLPDQLRGYRTSYYQKLGELLDFRDGNISYEAAKSFLPNCIRTVLESFLSFKFRVLHHGSSGGKFMAPGLDRLIKTLEGQAGFFKEFKSIGNISADTIILVLQEIKTATDPQSHGGVHEIQDISFISEQELRRINEDAINVIQFLDCIHFQAATR